MSRRPFRIQPEVEFLEDRLPPGDTLHLLLFQAAFGDFSSNAPSSQPTDRPASSARVEAAQRRQERFSFPPALKQEETYGSGIREVAVASPVLFTASVSNRQNDFALDVAASRPSQRSSATTLLFPPKSPVTFHPGVPLPRDPWQSVPSASNSTPWLQPPDDQGDNYRLLDNPPPGGGGSGGGQVGDNGGTFYLEEGETQNFWFDTGINATYVWDFYRINWGDGNIEEGSAMGVWSPPFIATQHAWGDNGTFNITVSWWNYAGQSGGTTATVHVSNVTPEVDVNLGPFINIFQENTTNDSGTEVGVWITMIDPGWLDTVTMSVDWGDGMVDELVYPPGAWPDHYIHQSFWHNYLDDDPTGTPEDMYTIIVTAKDDDGGIDTDSDTLTFQNVDPLVQWELTPWQLAEGGLATLKVWTKDNPHDDHVLRIDWGDGSGQTVIEDAPITGFPSFGYTPDPLVFQHLYVDDDPTATPWDNYPLSVTLKDDDGGYSGDGIFPLRVDNLPPTAELVDDGPWLPGEQVTVRFTNVQDPGLADTHLFAVDWNSDGDFDDADEGWSPESVRSHIIPDAGNYLIMGALQDDDTGIGKAYVPIQVGPVAELDVNYNGAIRDAVDGSRRYLPGYLGDKAVLSVGDTYNNTSYTGQKMKILVEGIGRLDGITEATFQILDCTLIPGYAENASANNLEGDGRTKDFSFEQDIDQDTRELTLASDGGVISGGRIENKQVWADFWCKDYGGKCRVQVTLKNNGQTVRTFTLNIPVDTDNDGLSDAWEQQMLSKWNQQYQGQPQATGLNYFNAAFDNEWSDADGPGPLTAQGGFGDGLKGLTEYRGFILDGGGFDGAGQNPHTGGHIRLSFARKEGLLEVDHVSDLLFNPGEGKLRDYLDVTAKVWSHATRGAGNYVYYVVQDEQLPDPTTLPDMNLRFLPTDNENAIWTKQFAFQKANRGIVGNTTSAQASFEKHFTHVIILNDLPAPPNGPVFGGHRLSDGWALAENYAIHETRPLLGRGIYLLHQAMRDKRRPNGVEVFPTLSFASWAGTLLAHEFGHMVLRSPFVSGMHPTSEHLITPNDEVDLMYDSSNILNRDASRVQLTMGSVVNIQFAQNASFVE
jgi:hypothetical protein